MCVHNTHLEYACQRKPLCITAHQLVVYTLALAFKGQHVVFAMDVPVNAVVDVILLH